MSNLNNEHSLEDIIGFMDDDSPVAGDGSDFTPSSPEFDTSRIFGENEEPANTEEVSEEEVETEEEVSTNTTTIVETTSNTSTTTPDTTATNDYTEYFNLLKDNNLLHVDEEFQFDGTAESLGTAINQTSANLQKVAYSSLWEALPEEWKPALTYAISGGTDVSKYLSTFKSQDLENLNIKDSTENQRLVLKEYYKSNSNYSDEKIERLIDKLHLLGEMEQEAEVALTELKEIESTKRQELADQQLALVKAQQDQLKQNRDTINSIIDTSEAFESTRKGKLKAYIFNEMGNNKDSFTTQLEQTLNSIENNKEHYVQLADFLMSTYDPKTGFNLERYTKKETSKATKTLKERLEALNNKTNVSGDVSKVTSNNFSWEAFINQN